MSAIKKTVSISEEIVNEAISIEPNFSAVVEAALVEYLHVYKQKKAIESFGRWQSRKEKSVDIVNAIRREKDTD